MQRESTPPAVQTRQLYKQFRGPNGEPIHALKGVDLVIQRGQIYALLGPNGAGKTTLISILTTLLAPTAGSVSVAGFDVHSQGAQVRRNIGLTFQETVLDVELTGRRILDFHGQLYGMHRQLRRDRVRELAAMVDLDEALDRQVKGYSGGMKRRLELARGLMTDPQVLFLDEPTQGLDPHNRAGIWGYIRRLRADRGVTLLLTTHYMEEAEALADRVGILDRGQLVVEGSPAELVDRMGADVIALQGRGDPEPLVRAARSLPYVQRVSHHALDQELSLVQLGVDAGSRRLVETVSLAAASAFLVQEVTVARPSLADVFLEYTGRALRPRWD